MRRRWRTGLAIAAEVATILGLIVAAAALVVQCSTATGAGSADSNPPVSEGLRRRRFPANYN